MKTVKLHYKKCDKANETQISFFVKAQYTNQCPRDYEAGALILLVVLRF